MEDTPSENELVLAYQQGDQKAATTLYRNNYRWIHWLTQKLPVRPNETWYGCVYQTGCITFFRAAFSFDPTGKANIRTFTKKPILRDQRNEWCRLTGRSYHTSKQYSTIIPSTLTTTSYINDEGLLCQRLDSVASGVFETPEHECQASETLSFLQEDNPPETMEAFSFYAAGFSRPQIEQMTNLSPAAFRDRQLVALKRLKNHQSGLNNKAKRLK